MQYFEQQQYMLLFFLDTRRGCWSTKSVVFHCAKLDESFMKIQTANPFQSADQSEELTVSMQPLI